MGLGSTGFSKSVLCTCTSSGSMVCAPMASPIVAEPPVQCSPLVVGKMQQIFRRCDVLVHGIAYAHQSLVCGKYQPTDHVHFLESHFQRRQRHRGENQDGKRRSPPRKKSGSVTASPRRPLLPHPCNRNQPTQWHDANGEEHFCRLVLLKQSPDAGCEKVMYGGQHTGNFVQIEQRCLVLPLAE